MLTNSDGIKSNLVSIGFMAFCNLTNHTHLILLLTSALINSHTDNYMPFLNKSGFHIPLGLHV